MAFSATLLSPLSSTSSSSRFNRNNELMFPFRVNSSPVAGSIPVICPLRATEWSVWPSVIGATLCIGTIADCVVCPATIFAATSCISDSSGRLSITVPPVRTHGSNAASILAPPLSIVDGPKRTVADCGGQPGVAVTAPAKVFTVNPPLVTVT
jgi:hypothetical protein